MKSVVVDRIHSSYEDRSQDKNVVREPGCDWQGRENDPYGVANIHAWGNAILVSESAAAWDSCWRYRCHHSFESRANSVKHALTG